jgi:hypothetical protein
MQFSAEMIAGRTFPIVTEGYDPIAVAAFLWEVADDYATLLNAASNLLEAVSPEGEDGQDGGTTGHSRPERRHLKRVEVASARLLLEAKVDAELLREATGRIDRVLAMEQAMLEVLRMARDGHREARAGTSVAGVDPAALVQPHPDHGELEAQSTNGPLNDPPKNAAPEGEGD